MNATSRNQKCEVRFSLSTTWRRKFILHLKKTSKFIGKQVLETFTEQQKFCAFKTTDACTSYTMKKLVPGRTQFPPSSAPHLLQLIEEMPLEKRQIEWNIFRIKIFDVTPFPLQSLELQWGTLNKIQPHVCSELSCFVPFVNVPPEQNQTNRHTSFQPTRGWENAKPLLLRYSPDLRQS